MWKKTNLLVDGLNQYTIGLKILDHVVKLWNLQKNRELKT